MYIMVAEIVKDLSTFTGSDLRGTSLLIQLYK